MRKNIFISYAHQDEEWKDRLVTHLTVLERQGFCNLWHDRKIRVGFDWPREIEEALNNAHIAILMISSNFLASDFIMETELPRILERRETGQLLVIPLIVKPCAWNEDPCLSEIQALPKDGKPLSEGEENHIDADLTTVVKTISRLIKGESVPTGAFFSMRKAAQSCTVLLTPLPARKIQLIGRDNELKMLDQRLKKTNRVLLINGLGGIGKTEVCKRFFYLHYRSYAFAGWFDYVNSLKETLVNAVDWESQTAKDYMAADKNDLPDVRFRKIMQFLSDQDKETLLVVDNIEDAQDEDLDKLMALPANVKVIANSRLHIEGFETHGLDFLSAAECKALFYEFYQGETDDGAVEKIVDLCGFHTLTVELLARTAQAAALSVKDFYQTLTEKGFNLNDTIRDRVGTFWHDQKDRERFFNHLLKIFELSGVTESELHILTNLSILPAVYIPVRDISQWMKLESNDDINNLVRKGWLRRTGMTIFMHQVIQEVIRYRATPDVEKCSDLIISLVWKLKVEPGDNPLDKKGLVIFAESVLLHIDEDNENLAILSNNLSYIYHALGQYEKALEFQLKALKVREKAPDAPPSILATSYNNVAAIYQKLNQLEKAKEFQLKAMEIWKKEPNKNPLNLATGYNNLSEIYRRSYLKKAEEFQKAEEFHLKAVKIMEELDKKHPYLATSYNNLSTLYHILGRLEDALGFQLKAINIREEVLDKNHTSLATSYNNLAMIYKDLKDFELAEEYGEKAVAIMQRNFPNGHPDLDLYKRNLEEIRRRGKGK